MISLPLLLVFFAEIKWFDPHEAATYQIWHPYCLIHLKYQTIQLFLSALFKRFWNVPIKIRNGWIILT